MEGVDQARCGQPAPGGSLAGYRKVDLGHQQQGGAPGLRAHCVLSPLCAGPTGHRAAPPLIITAQHRALPSATSGTEHQKGPWLAHSDSGRTVPHLGGLTLPCCVHKCHPLMGTHRFLETLGSVLHTTDSTARGHPNTGAGREPSVSSGDICEQPEGQDRPLHCHPQLLHKGTWESSWDNGLTDRWTKTCRETQALVT